MEENKMYDYYVNDLVPEQISKLQFIFIFESPHNSEILSGIPVSGPSGISIMKYLGYEKNSIGFGEFVKNNHADTTAIMNICNQPLQKVENDFRKKEVLNIYNFIRNNYSSLTHHKKESVNIIERCLLDKFKAKIGKIVYSSEISSKVNIFICGRFAEAYFKKAFPNNKYFYLPHPSRNGWKNLDDSQITLLKGMYSK